MKIIDHPGVIEKLIFVMCLASIFGYSREPFEEIEKKVMASTFTGKIIRSLFRVKICQVKK